MSLPRSRTPVQEVLFARPYLRADLIPLAAALCVAGYADGARDAVLDGVIYGRTLADLVASGALEPADHEAAAVALERGRQPQPAADPGPFPGRPAAPTAEEIRVWLDSRPSFQDWLAAEGGTAWEETDEPLWGYE
jgi:hypothetical protein